LSDPIALEKTMDSDLTFRTYQEQSSRTDRAQGTDLKSIMIPLLGLAGEAGSLLTEYKKWLREGDRYKPFTDQVSEEIGDLLWYLANIAQKAGLDLQEIAEENLAKLADRQRGAAGLFSGGLDRYDASFQEHERLPLKLEVVFREREIDGRRKLEVKCDNRPFGDALTDNSHADDGYRYHDIFHLAHAILLGWSPIVRKLLKLKRKSIPNIDEVEDGARAGITEEAISALVFGYAKDYSFFEGADSVDYELLRAIKLMTRPFEVRDKTYRDWEEAILAGYTVWRQMVNNGGGIFVGNAESRSVAYRPLPLTENSPV
jgi:NTP pyrophosphatase (non-canonical NTP hydrolase)